MIADGGATFHQVAFVWMLDTIHEAFVGYSAWWFLIARCNNGNLGCNETNWSTISQVVPSEICAVIIEYFFIYRILELGRSRWYLLLGPLPLIAFAFSIRYIYKCYVLPGWQYTTVDTWALTAFAATRVVADVLIAIIMCYLLYNSRGGVFPKTRSIIGHLINWTICTGVLTSIVAGAYMLTYLAMPLNMIYIAIYFTHSKVYINSMLAVLNSRNKLRQIQGSVHYTD
ncbi:hypothetical protein OE88DRAFT_1739772 [Heliocybe sulcata]|uniref:DUF6534 domain-containing protein n=1 Tax=Heliocybe sulcata TaxID=5364 RepID=A0A5C3MM50_9AGAM|nr:hypothetical protein OE88DRAFT_1739772 [Heliocybe sulcata]